MAEDDDAPSKSSGVSGPVVRAIGWTHFEPPRDVPWSTDAAGGPALVEFAGRACYQSWSKPNPETATNDGYIGHILDVGHYSVLEHGTVTFYLTGVSRSFTHELVRHRHLSFSQLSQRYVADAGQVVEPQVIADDPYLHRVFTETVETVERAYGELLHALERKLATPTCWCVDPCRCVPKPPPSTAARKQARQAARAVLPNATETRIVVTGNYRAWRHFVDMRATPAADIEIRQVAVAILRELLRVAPTVFNDYVIHDLPDGTEAAATPYAERS